MSAEGIQKIKKTVLICKQIAIQQSRGKVKTVKSSLPFKLGTTGLRSIQLKAAK